MGWYVLMGLLSRYMCQLSDAQCPGSFKLQRYALQFIHHTFLSFLACFFPSSFSYCLLFLTLSSPSLQSIQQNPIDLSFFIHPSTHPHPPILSIHYSLLLPGSLLLFSPLMHVPSCQSIHPHLHAFTGSLTH